MAVLMPPFHLRRRRTRRQAEKRRGFLQDVASLPISASFIETIAGLQCILGSICKLVCGAAVIDGLGDATRMTESDENVCCPSREFIETLCTMEPVDCDLLRR
jgi:hypothetical protein